MLWRSLASIGFLAFCGTTNAVTVTVDLMPSHPIPTTLWGMMFEDINSGDGGLYGELLVNRAFQQVTPGTSAALTGWSAVNGASLSVVKASTPVSSALPNALQVAFPSGKSGAVGFSNGGFYGMKVTSGSTYTASFYYRFPSSSGWSGSATIALKTTSGTTLGSTTTMLLGGQTSWKQITVTFKPSTSGSGTSNLFSITIDGSAGAQTIQFAMFSLFPPTFKNRANGMRADIAEALYAAGPTFFRFPGGNNLEGETVATRWQWNATVGSLVNRPGRNGDWGYGNTDGLGLLEYLNWCEDTGMEPIMAVWSGYALGGEIVASGNLQPYIQQAIDQINFVVGDPAKSSAAALRASLGHPAPFKLNYVEVGNEDFINTAPSSYGSYRWNMFVTALKAAFPNINFLATTNVNDPVLSPKPTHYDVHVYQTPNWFTNNAFYYDAFARDGTKYFEGEYAAISTNDSDIWNHRLQYPTMWTAAGEAAFMTGLERNADIVFAAAYAPLLNHVSGTQWTPNLVSFDSANVFLSTSYYVQKLFGTNRGDDYVPSTLPTKGDTLHWSVVRKSSTNQLIIKVANAGSSPQTLSFILPFGRVASSGTLQLLVGAQGASNTPTSPDAIVPQYTTIPTGRTFDYNAPAYSVSVITFAIGVSTGTTTTSTSTTTSTAPGATQTRYGQCGGTGYIGPAVCASGTICVYSNDYYSECLSNGGN